MKKIFFMGANRIGCLCLGELLKWEGVEVIGVLPRFFDRGDNLDPHSWNVSVRDYAQSKGLKVYDFESTNRPEFREILASLGPDYILSVQYDLILRQAVLDIPKLGSVNIHFAPLPRYRGCFPIAWAIIDGNPAGVSMHWIDKGIDTGRIIEMREIPVLANDTARSIYEKAMVEGFKIFKEVFPRVLQENIMGQLQSEEESIYHSAGYPYDRWINWQQDAIDIDKFIRALTFESYPSARTTYQGKKFELIHPIKALTGSKNKGQPGQIINIAKDTLTIACGAGAVSVRRLRLDAQGVVGVSEFLKEVHFKKGDILESGETK